MSSLTYARRPAAATQVRQQAQLVTSSAVFQLTGGGPAGVELFGGELGWFNAYDSLEEFIKDTKQVFSEPIRNTCKKICNKFD